MAAAVASAPTGSNVSSTSAGGPSTWRGRDLSADFLAELKKSFTKNVVKVPTSQPSSPLSTPCLPCSPLPSPT